MAEILIRLTRPGDAEEVADNLRDSDRAELAALGYDDPTGPVRDSVKVSHTAWSALTADGRVVCIFGVAPYEDGVGAPWMLGTPLLEAHARVLVRMTPRYIERMRQVYPHLLNFVHAENTTSVRWLRRLGFTLTEPQPHGARGALFHTFEMRA